MKYITVKAVFDDMDSAEAAARKLRDSCGGIQCIKLHYRRQDYIDPDSFTDVALTAANQTNYVNVGYGVIPPQGAAPMFAVYQPVGKAPGYSERKVYMTVTAPKEKEKAIVSCIYNTSGRHISR